MTIQNASLRCGLLILAVVLFALCVRAQQSTGASLRGQVVDELGGLITEATVTVTSENGSSKTVKTDKEGNYVVTGLASGKCSLRVVAPGFAIYENSEIELASGSSVRLKVEMKIAPKTDEVRVGDERSISTAPEQNASAIILRGTDLDALPDDPEDFIAALQALAGPAAGPSGGQIYVDGFLHGRVPPKSSISEVRLNQNPFSAEYEELGVGRIEIFTKPGTDRFKGEGFFNISDASFNSRNPFAVTRAPYQSRLYGGNVSGPLTVRKSSYFLDFERQETNDNAIINATVLDPQLNVNHLNQVIVAPQRSTTFGSRLDYKLNQKSSLVARYSYTNRNRDNAGIGDFSLQSRAFNRSYVGHIVQFTVTSVLSPRVLNELRFQYARDRTTLRGDASLPTIRVLDSFTGGGSQVGFSSNAPDRLELSNSTLWTQGRHTLKVGGRGRFVRIVDLSPSNFAGTFTFAGGLAPQLDENDHAELDTAGEVVLIPITSLERYRRTLLFQARGLTPAQIRELGGGASQFSLAGGNPTARVSQFEFGAFIQDDWRMRPNFMLSMGLRYENQTNIHSNLNLAPRVAFAWSPINSQDPKTIIRGGFGMFYQRFNEGLTLQAKRFNGVNQRQFIVSDPDFFPVAPPIESLIGVSLPQTIRSIASNVEAPYIMQTVIGVERKLPLGITLTINYAGSRMLHVLRSRNINAPLPGTFIPGVPTSGVRPFGNIGNIFQVESSGRLNQNQLFVNARAWFSRKLTLFATYVLNDANSDTLDANVFPSNSYDLRIDYGRSALSVRHRLVLGGTIGGPWDTRFNPFVVGYSSRPFNITTGVDNNGDALFTDRPAFATDLTNPNLIFTRFGIFNLNPGPGDLIIPRNLGDAPGFFSINLRVSKVFRFGAAGPAANVKSAPAPNARASSGGGSAAGGSGAGRSSNVSAEKRYSLTFSVQIQNLLNHTNPATPVGSLTSPLFGVSTATSGGFGAGGGSGSAAGNRIVEAQIRLTF